MCKNRVASSYLTSKFFSHTTAEDLKENLILALQSLDQGFPNFLQMTPFKVIKKAMAPFNKNTYKLP